MKKTYESWIDNKYIRFILLVIAAILGLLLGKYLDIKYFGDWYGEKTAEYLNIATIGIFIFILLWIFRTRDTRQQIDKTQQQIDEVKEQVKKAEEQINKTQMQIYQSHFDSGFGNLTGDTRLKVEVGTQSLIKLSKAISEFDNSIRIAFIERIRYLPDDEFNGMPITYGRHILKWLFENNREIILQRENIYDQDPLVLRTKNELKGKDLSNEELICLLHKKDKKFIPEKADLSYQDLSRMDFRNAYFEGVNLKGSALLDSDLTDVIFCRSDLTGTHFADADLTGTHFEDCNLTNAKFVEFDLNASLSKIVACFESCNLTGADFGNVDLKDAHFKECNIKGAHFKKAINSEKARFENCYEE